MTETEKLMQHIESSSSKELASEIHCALKDRFGVRDEEFGNFYRQMLRNLRAKDALKNQNSKLNSYVKKQENAKKKFEDDQKDWKKREDIQKLYAEWKEKKRAEKNRQKGCRGDNIDIPTFFHEEYNKILKCIPETMSLSRVRWLLKKKNVDAPKKREVCLPDFLNQIDLDNPAILLSSSEKSDVELLEELGKSNLKILLITIVENWDALDLNPLKIDILFLFAQWMNSNTKEKKRLRNLSKTNGKGFKGLWKKYYELLNKIEE